MLKIFTSNTGNNAAHLVMTELARNNAPDSNHIVIVPDRFAMSVEKELFEYLGLEGAFNIDVVSFTRLAVKHLKGKDQQCLTKEGGVVLLSSILLEEQDNLKFYHRLVGKRELAKDLYAVIASLRSSRITPQKLRAVFGDKPSSVRDKYEDIAHLIEVYEERLQLIKGDSLTRLNRFEDTITSNAVIAASHVYVIGFDTFKGNEYDIISKLVKTAQSVNVALNLGEDGAQNARLFAIKEARKLKREIGGEIIRSTKKLPKAIEEVYSSIFSLKERQVKKTDRIVLAEEPTTYAEIKGIALEIASLIRQGYRYCDVAVVIHDDSLKGIIEDVFTRLDIPLYVDKKYCLKDTLVARLVDSAINVQTAGYDRDKVLAFARNPLLGISYGDIEHLNDYILRHNLNYQYLQETFLAGEDAAEMERIRRDIVNRLPDFASSFLVQEGVDKVRKLYKDLPSAIYDTLYGIEGVYPNKIIEGINKRAADLLDQELDEFCHLVGDQQVSLEDFYSMIKGGIESVEISLIPNVMDAVFVGTNSDSRFFDKKIIFIAGAVDGVMPVSPSYHAIMPERDIAMMEREEVFVYPTPVETIRRDKAGLAELLTTATDRVYVSYAQFSVSGAKQNMGELFKQLKFILSENEVVSLSQKYSCNNAESLGNLNNAYYEYLRRKSKANDLGSERFLGLLSDKLVSAGYDLPQGAAKANSLTSPLAVYLAKKGGKYYVYPTQIERFYQCPYRHFLQYALSLQECETGDADARLIGIFLHEVLERFFVETKGRLKDMTDEDIEKVAETIAQKVSEGEEYRHLYNDPRNSKLLKDIKKEGVENILRMMPQIRVSSYTPSRFEYKFEIGNLATSIGSEDVAMRGTIDRIDVCGDKFLIVDYKTGSVKGKDATYKLYYGTNLQPYLYLSALIEEGLTPVGAFYLSVSAGYEKDGDKVSRFVGKITTDEEELKLLDKELSIEDAKVVTTALPSTLYWAKDSISAKDNGGFSREDFAFSAEYARGMVARALRLMQDGYIDKHPIEGACDYCEYSALCADCKTRKTTAQNIRNGAFVGGAKDE